MKKNLKVKIFFVLMVVGVGGSMLAYAFTGPTAAPPSGEGYFWRLNGSNLYYPFSGSGNIGVGTSTPYHKIDAVGDVSASGYVRGTTGLCLAGDCRTSWPTGGTSGGWTDGGTAVYLTTATDNVGLGTTNPLAKLYISGSTDRQIASDQWIDFSANPSGYGLVGGNAYTKRGDSTFRYSNSHASIGAVGFATNYPSWNKASIFVNAGPSTAGSTFTPNTVATFESSGEVGIGTATPGYKLHVSGGDAYVSGYVYGNTGLCLAGDCRTSWPGGVGGSGVNNYLAKWNGSADITSSIIYDNGTNVGIGTASPGYKLDVNGVARIQGTTKISTGNLTVDSGMVGIGTASPTHPLDVIGDTYITGNVGIGGLPNYKLYVGDGTAYVRNGSVILEAWSTEQVIQVTDGFAFPSVTMSLSGVNSNNYFADGTAGLTQTINVRKADNSGSCTITTKYGLVTATTCP